MFGGLVPAPDLHLVKIMLNMKEWITRHGLENIIFGGKAQGEYIPNIE